MSWYRSYARIKMPGLKKAYDQLGVMSLYVLLIVQLGCVEPQQSEGSRGEELAQLHCATCHQLPSPSLLDKSTWASSTLPVMGARLGIYESGQRDALVAPLLKEGLDPAGIFPVHAALQLEDWNAITSYYTAAAPERLIPATKPDIKIGLEGFRIQPPSLSFSPRLTTMVGVLETFQAFFVANLASPSTLVLLDKGGELLYKFEFPQAPVATIVDGTRLYVLVIGNSPAPSVESNGAIYVIDDPSVGPVPLIEGLQRPVDFNLVDLNGDQRKDLLINEYGHYTGALSWYEQVDNGQYIRHELHRGPGAIQSELHDFDGDGLEDIAVLMGQGDERLDIYFQKSAGQFEVKQVLRFPAVYGSTSFTLEDFDGDGRTDILYTNGDNADSSPIPKPNHGIRIFKSLGPVTYEEHYFYPLNGAYAAKVADFDLDGDLDIAAIAYFPDYERRPEESFALLTNQGGFNFEASTFEKVNRGRWLVMDVGDIDGDSDQDILLGSNIGFGPQGDQTGLFQQWEQENISYVILENETR